MAQSGFSVLSMCRGGGDIVRARSLSIQTTTETMSVVSSTWRQVTCRHARAEWANKQLELGRNQIRDALRVGLQ